MSKFIVLEGIDGSGKSSMSRFLSDKFQEVYLTKEPTDSETGTMAQKIANKDTSPYMDLFLYLADRVEHIDKIKGKLEGGIDVICDRYWGSTAAYQSAYDQIELSYVVSIQKPFILEPDLTILLDLKSETALNRISKRHIKSKYERLNFLKKVRDNYLDLAKKHGWMIIDAEKNIEDVKDDISCAMDEKLGLYS